MHAIALNNSRSIPSSLLPPSESHKLLRYLSASPPTIILSLFTMDKAETIAMLHFAPAIVSHCQLARE